MADRPSELGDYDRGRLASRAIKKHFSKLSKSLATEDILLQLFQEDLVSGDLFDVVLSAPKRSGIEARVIRKIQQRVQAVPDKFDDLCRILQENGLKYLSSSLKETFAETLETASESNPNLPHFSQEFLQMKQDLDLYARQLSKGIGNTSDIDKLIKSLTTLTIENALKNGESLESVRNQMHTLSYTTFSIPPRLGAWAMQEVEDVYKKFSSTSSSGAQGSSEDPISPVSLPVTSHQHEKLLYHSSLCCLAVNRCTTATFDEFLNDHGHNLTEAKLSISQDKVNVDRYMIAEQGSTVYVAFQSEPDLSHWLASPYSSFDEGFKKQTSRIPLRFFEEQLADNKEIVFTGFGFGGMLACYVAASLWKESFITMDILERNVTCITFGQPLIGIPFDFFSEAISLSENFRNSIHAYLDREDIYPALLCHLLGYIDNSEGNQCREWHAPISTQKLKGSFSSQLFHTLSTFTEKKSYSTVTGLSVRVTQLQEIKEILKKSCAAKELEPDVPFVEATILSSLPMATKVVAHQESSKDFLIAVRHELANLNVSSFSKFNMGDYHERIMKYVGKEVIPTQSVVIANNGYLRPDVRAIEFHKYPTEHAVILEGENLWFCHEIRLGQEENIINIEDRGDDVSQHLIQFNYSPTKKTDLIVSDNGIVKVALKSHFSNPVRRKIKVKQEPHEFSVRQIQLARYTPTELIRLAYWSALLEQLPSVDESKPPSRRLKKIAEFLQEAVRIVPLESILSAVAFAEDKTAFKCAKALLQSHPIIPPSAEAVLSAQIGAVRLHTGLHGSVVHGLISRTMNEIHAQFLFSHCGKLSVVAQTSTTIQVSVNILVPMAPFPFLYSDVSSKKFTRKPSSLRGEVFYQDLHVPTTHDVTRLIPSNAEKDEDLAKQLNLYSKKLFDDKKILGTISNLNIEHIYPVLTSRRHSLYLSTLQSPLDVLNNARTQIASFCEEIIDSEEEALSSDDVIPSNEKMLNLLREIDENNLKVCAALLGSFMEQQISIPLIKSEVDTANILFERSSPVAIGAWVLFNSGYAGVLSKLSSRKGSPLLVQIADYISGILSDGLEKPPKSTSKYDAKLQFLLHGIKKTVSCSTQYISYSLERQLCKNLKFKESISVQDLIDRWDSIFEGDALSLVARSHRPLTARWLKWAVLIHNLREAMAEYTCIGVTGLVNSGKSQLVSKLFGVKTPVGTTGHRRTTIPLLYNLDGKVDGLDVIDFPGVDDSEHSIPELASLLLGLLQVVIFVVDYKRVFSDASTSWLKFLGEKKIPVIMCLTFGDHLYFEVEERQKQKSKEPTETSEDIKRIIAAELYDTRKKLREKFLSSLEFLNYYCFHLPEMQKSREEDLKVAGVLRVEDVGEQVAKLFKLKKMTDLANRLLGYQYCHDQMALLSTTGDDRLQKPSSLAVRSRNISNVPFLGEPVVFKCDSSGGESILSSHGISVKVPEGAIPKGKQIQFEIAVTLVGPFQFSNGKRPISPILWLCTHEEVTFQKPIQVKLPHFLAEFSDEEKLKFKVNFAKAGHPTIGSTEAPIPQVEFKPCETKSQFIVTENGSYGLLQTTHCCFLCIEAEHSKDLALRAGYCLTRVEYQPSPSRHAVHFCATFQLDTCLDALQKQYPEEYSFVSTNFMFKDADDNAVNPELHLLRPSVDSSACIVALEPKKGRIRLTDIDFWAANVDIEGMKLRQKNLTYPPRIRMTLGLKSLDMLIIPIEFKGCTDDSNLDIDLMVKAQARNLSGSATLSSVLTTKEDSEECLEMKDHFDVTQYLSELTTEKIWRLGGALGLYYPKLKKMKNPLEDMVEAWLNREDNVCNKSGSPHWKSLVKALKEIDCTGHAEKIRKDKL